MPDHTNPNRPGSASLDQHAHRIADAVDAAWHRRHGYGHLEVPVSVVAALALLAPHPHERDAVAAHISRLDAAEFAALMRTQWAAFLTHRPDLVNPVWPLAEVWHGHPALSASAGEGARAVAHAALAAGQLDLTGDRESRWSTDLFGVLVTVMKGRNAKAAHGAFYTPGHLAEVIARVGGTAEIPDGEAVHEPTAGTGGMLRAAAQAMRGAGRDPARLVWVANDVDALAVACMAVNAVLWELGPRIVLGVGDTLSEEWIERALAQREETLKVASDMRRLRELADAFAALQNRVEPHGGEPQEGGGPV